MYGDLMMSVIEIDIENEEEDTPITYCHEEPISDYKKVVKKKRRHKKNKKFKPLDQIIDYEDDGIK